MHTVQLNYHADLKGASENQNENPDVSRTGMKAFFLLLSRCKIKDDF